MVITLRDNDPLDKLRRSAKRYIEKKSEKELLELIVNCIGERRSNDLLDILASEESKRGWQKVVFDIKHILGMRYSIPLGFTKNKLEIEELKFREVIFDTLGCRGLEAIPLSIDLILEKLNTCENMTEAQNTLAVLCEEGLNELISKGALLFFDSSEFAATIKSELLSQIESRQEQNISQLYLSRDDQYIDITALWHTELGRRALLNIGIKGTKITETQMDLVISVLQVSRETKKYLMESLSENKQAIETKSLNPLYNELLQYMIEWNISGLRSLGSRFAIPLFRHITIFSFEKYSTTEDSKTYNEYLESLKNHVLVRTSESLEILEYLSQKSDPRIASPAITYLGNFYTATVSSILVDLVCSSKKKVIQHTAVTALKNVQTRCPETKNIVELALKADCQNRGRLLKFYRDLWQK